MNGEIKWNGSKDVMEERRGKDGGRRERGSVDKLMEEKDRSKGGKRT